MLSAALGLIMLVSYGAAARAGWDEGAAAYDSGDYETAMREFRPLAEQGDARAQYSIGNLYYFGYGVRADDAETALRFRSATKAFEQGHKQFTAALELHEIYRITGNDVPGNYTEAIRWYSLAANKGHGDAQIRLGYIYEKGKGVPEGHIEAVRWYRLAAEQGLADGQLNLARKYRRGEGVLQDYGEAMRWYTLSAYQGNYWALLRLGNMYHHGWGVRKDYVTAHMWYNLAQLKASDTGHIDFGKSVLRDVEKFMSAAQVVKAQRMAREWRPQNEPADNEPLMAERPPPKPTHTLPREDIAFIQEQLAKFGYNPGPADGIAGEKTRSAIRAYERDNNIAVTGEPSAKVAVSLATKALTAALEAIVPSAAELEIHSTGSGVAVSGLGHILTNAHVVEGCQEIRIADEKAALVFRHVSNDLALLYSVTAVNTPVNLREGRDIRLGDTIIVAGYPLQGLLTSDLTVTTGTVSATSGINNDRQVLQITSPVQAGNSGGPLLDSAGNLVGIVVAKLNAVKVAEVTGDLPQNVNFALRAGVIRAFLDANGVAYTTASSNKSLEVADVAEQARGYTVRVECWK